MFDRAMRRYQETEPTIHAWVEVNPQPPTGSGPLDGIPFGVKDIFETAGLATEYGSAVYAGRKGEYDADVVYRLRDLGAVLFGKTTTAAFASFDPPATRNPRNPEHTPGGSSSGSAAAVAAGVVPLALGTQTLGSVIRPASFCGVVGFKPTFGMVSKRGVLAFAPALDTVGFFANDVALVQRVWRALGHPLNAPSWRRFWLVEGLPEVEPVMAEAFAREVERIARAHGVGRIRLPRDYAEIYSGACLVNDYEGARSHEQRYDQFGERLGPKLAALVQRGLTIPDPDHCRALEYLEAVRFHAGKRLGPADVILAPAASGPAPRGLGSTGDPLMNGAWTALHMPAVTVPMPRAPGELPLGLQMIGARGTDAMLLATARWYETLCATR
jgi:Asp-tRNA(Asn)/Glu-tRNA(Gln) amidotransferase A subunit family amidase